jgi:hypothetical protein
MKEDTVQVARGYTEWIMKTGGFARDMTLRDHFAGLAMQGLLMDEAINKGSDNAAEWVVQMAKASYIFADAMLKERNK